MFLTYLSCFYNFFFFNSFITCIFPHIQLDIAVRASQDAQALLRSQSENAKATMFKDDEFKSLQHQVCTHISIFFFFSIVIWVFTHMLKNYLL